MRLVKVSELKKRICGSLGERCINCGHELGDHDDTGCNWKRHGSMRMCDCSGYQGEEENMPSEDQQDEKVYCCVCRSFKEEGGIESCHSPNNCYPTWKSPCGHRKNPIELNAFNSCEWYKVKK